MCCIIGHVFIAELVASGHSFHLFLLLLQQLNIFFVSLRIQTIAMGRKYKVEKLLKSKRHFKKQLEEKKNLT